MKLVTGMPKLLRMSKQPVLSNIQTVWTNLKRLQTGLPTPFRHCRLKTSNTLKMKNQNHKKNMNQEMNKNKQKNKNQDQEKNK